MMRLTQNKMSVGMLRGLLEGLRTPSLRLLPLEMRTPYIKQTRGYPSQKYHKIMAENRKRNKLRKLQKAAEVKPSFAEFSKAKLKKTVLESRRYTEKDWPTKIVTDDVFLLKDIKRPCFDLPTCLQMHREILHPTMYNKTNSLLMATVELDMRAKKKNRFLDQLSGSLLLPHFFEYKRQALRILCFCKSADEATLALERGANLAGGEQLIKKIECGEVNVASFDLVLCHVNMYEAIQPLKNILKKQMPRPGQGSCISDDVLTLIERHRKAVIYTARGDVYEPDYASLTIPIANLQMPDDQIHENIKELFIELNDQRPKGRPINSFISEVFLSCPPSLEKFVLEKTPYLLPTPGDNQSGAAEEDEREESVLQAG